MASVTFPIGIPGGKSESSEPLEKPAVTTIWPSLISSPLWTKLSWRSRGLPTFGSTTPVAPLGSTRPVTELSGR